MIITEQNRRNEEFSSTRTFSVPSNSADSLKNRINQANEHNLSERNDAARRARPTNAVDPSRRPMGPDGVQASANNTRPVDPRQSRPQNVQQPQRPISAQQGGQVPRQRAEQPVRANSANAQVRDRQQMPASVQNRAVSHQPVRVQNQAQNPQQERAVRVQNQQNVQAQSRMAANQPQAARPQDKAPNRVMPQGSPTDNRPANLPKVQRQMPAPMVSPEPKNVQQNQPVKPESAAVLSARREQNSVQPAKQSQQKLPIEAKKRGALEVGGRTMMQTKQNDISSITSSVKLNKKKADDYEYEGSDEGGNTIVSVIKAIVYIIFVIVVSVFLAVAVINVGNDVFAFVKSDEIVEVTIPEYASLDDVAEALYQKEVIKYPTIFKLYAIAKEDDGEFVAGTYSISPMTNYENLLESFKEQPVTGIVRITIPEGSTTDEIINIFLAKGIGTREGFVDVIENYEFDYWFVKELEENGTHEDRIYRLDGYLFPDTYDFYLNSSEYTVINKLLKRFTQIFTKEYRDKCVEYGYTVDEIITLASIIEKEAGMPWEFITVSSVFHNRLNSPWNFPYLESDATIVYVLSHEKGERTPITAADLDYDTPYNTYMYKGLPPGPIANPSASAMLASLTPQDTDYYFFVANKGKTYFSETKEEHDAYIAQFKAEAQGTGTQGN
ncbi:MAG: endolytic transglycosylase MltG [Ruminococcaceae bacterium]|nr:endolytic transglycosylase MltG [Oscillospiraceae bacterium]